MLYRIWKYFTPFSLLQDTSRGSFAERAAAYSHNCRNRGCLTTYISRWLVWCTVALLLTEFFDTLGADAVFVILATAHAMFAAVAICAIFILAYAYFSLTYGAFTSGDANPRS